MFNKLLISVVNYCDPEFYNTVKSLWDKAVYKDRLFFSLVSEDKKEFDFSFIPDDQIRYLKYDISQYRGGLGWARNLATDIDINYDFFVQFDSHTYASYGWDAMAYLRYKKISENDNKFIICYAPAGYEILPNGDIDFRSGNIISKYAKYYDQLIPGFKFPGYEELIHDQEVISYWATCCYLFAPKAWVDEVGISKVESFNTEEFCLSLRTFAAGWRIYSIGTRDTFHHESHRQLNGTVTREVLRPWADERKEDYWKHVEEATNRLSLLMSGHLDVPKEKVQQFFQHTGLPHKYLKFIPNYSSHVVVEERSLGMPPRRS